MATQEIPRKFKHICDGCGTYEVRDTQYRPSYWTKLDITRDAYDYQGCAVADASIHKLLCRECSEKVFNAVNAATTRDIPSVSAA